MQASQMLSQALRRIPQLLFTGCALVLSLTLGSCRTSGNLPSDAPVEASAPAPAASAALIKPEWKERLAEAYIYVDHVGDYRKVGDSLRELFSVAREAGVTPVGPPFTLFFDDPGRVPFDRLRARACLPIDPTAGTLPASMKQDILPQGMVAYGRVQGAYDQVPQAYPKLLAYLEEHGWSRNGPIREVYLVDPGSVESWDELVTEVQIPWTIR